MQVKSLEEAGQAFHRVLYKAARPLGLLHPPLDKGVQYERDLFHHILEHPDYLIALDRPMMTVFTTLLEQEHAGMRIREGTLADNFLFMIGFFPDYLKHIYRRFGDDEQAMRSHVYSVMKDLYARSKNPHVREQRQLIARNVQAYVTCMHEAAHSFIEEDEDVAAGLARLEAIVQRRMKDVPSTLDELYRSDN